ncbi:MAG: hypothetical protein ACK53K_08285 [Burkholderiales bacterium]|jgi:hypothetical protein
MPFQSFATPLSMALVALAGVFPLSPAAAEAPSVSEKNQAPHASRHASSRDRLKLEARSLALATDMTETINEQQLEIAARVLTGPSHCEFRQQVHVQPVEGLPGQFRVNFKNLSYQMVPEETTSGAVRLMDKKAGVVWIQIPSKSMLMNSKLGQRLIDNCQHPDQQLAAEGQQTESLP